MADPISEATGATASVASGVAATVKKWTPINWALISNPWNWAIVLLMLVIATMALDVLLQWYNAPDVDAE